MKFHGLIDMRPWTLLSHFYDIDVFFDDSSTSIVRVKRECNYDADKLAKDGVSRSTLCSEIRLIS